MEANRLDYRSASGWTNSLWQSVSFVDLRSDWSGDPSKRRNAFCLYLIGTSFISPAAFRNVPCQYIYIYIYIYINTTTWYLKYPDELIRRWWISCRISWPNSFISLVVFSLRDSIWTWSDIQFTPIEREYRCVIKNLQSVLIGYLRGIQYRLCC